jgi:1-deoxy-D-xylulose-5-phosphate reductoisomerase
MAYNSGNLAPLRLGVRKRVAVLGATGSIGKSALDVLRNERSRFEPVLFTARKNAEELLKLKKEFPGVLTALADDELQSPAGIDFYGKEGLLKAIVAAGAEITINGIAGGAGLEPSVAVLKAGSVLALANKETIVMAGGIIRSLANEKKLSIIPVDSEHSAVFRLLEAHGKDNVSEIILTASGGPFKDHSREMLAQVTPKEALGHPTWNMGPKITIDSATMANKGLEVIEAAGLFGFPPEKIKVVIHPQSVVHSMIRLKNGAVYAQMSKPDMRLPIHEALNWPETEKTPFGVLDFDSLSLSFEKADFEKFPMLALAYDSLKKGPLQPVIYNAANEIAVEAFFEGKISFLEIPAIVGYVLSMSFQETGDVASIETILALDKKVRDLTGEFIRSGSKHANL